MALEVTVISAEDLMINRRHISAKKSIHVTVRTDSGRSSSSTTPNSDGGPYPKWNHKLSVNTPARSLTVEVRCSGDKLIGAVTIPAGDFSGGCLPADYLHFLSYRLRDTRGESNGIINISVRAVVLPGGVATSWSRPWMGMPAGVPISVRY